MLNNNASLPKPQQLALPFAFATSQIRQRKKKSKAQPFQVTLTQISFTKTFKIAFTFERLRFPQTIIFSKQKCKQKCFNSAHGSATSFYSGASHACASFTNFSNTAFVCSSKFPRCNVRLFDYVPTKSANVKRKCAIRFKIQVNFILHMHATH